MFTAAARVWPGGRAGSVIGMAAKVLLPALDARDDAFARFVEMQLPPLLAGVVLGAALAPQQPGTLRAALLPPVTTRVLL